MRRNRCAKRLIEPPPRWLNKSWMRSFSCIVRRQGREVMASKEVLNMLGRPRQATWLCLSLITLAGCVEDAAVFSGLKPDYPPPFRAGCATVTVLQPALRWQAFSPVETEGRVGEVMYELKVWAA